LFAVGKDYGELWIPKTVKKSATMLPPFKQN
jgi:hypothetical protein